jgi:hypothetical protein
MVEICRRVGGLRSIRVWTLMARNLTSVEDDIYMHLRYQRGNRLWIGTCSISFHFTLHFAFHFTISLFISLFIYSLIIYITSRPPTRHVILQGKGSHQHLLCNASAAPKISSPACQLSYDPLNF